MEVKSIYVYFDGSRAGIMEGEDSPAFFFAASKESFKKTVASYRKKGHKIVKITNEKDMTLINKIF